MKHRIIISLTYRPLIDTLAVALPFTLAHPLTFTPTKPLIHYPLAHYHFLLLPLTLFHTYYRPPISFLHSHILSYFSLSHSLTHPPSTAHSFLLILSLFHFSHSHSHSLSFHSTLTQPLTKLFISLTHSYTQLLIHSYFFTHSVEQSSN
jgi:hypothetical protein